MKRQAPSSKLSDRELRAMLQSLREDVAAPPAFRGQVLQRLAQQGLIAKAPSTAAPSLAQRFAAWINPARLGLLAGAACALALVLLPGLRAPRRSGSAPSAAQAAPAAQAAAPQAAALQPLPAAPAAKAMAASRRAVKAEAAEEQLQGEAVTADASPALVPAGPSQAEALAVGSAPAPASSKAMSVAGVQAPSGQAPQFGAAGAATAPSASPAMKAASANKPTIIVVKPSPTPLAKDLQGDSEVRNNVVRASRGESALVIFRVTQAGAVHIEIRDRLGRLVAVLKDEALQPGTYQLRWAGAADVGGLAASGIYQLSIQAPGYTAKHKLALVK